MTSRICPSCLGDIGSPLNFPPRIMRETESKNYPSFTIGETIIVSPHSEECRVTAKRIYWSESQIIDHDFQEIQERYAKREKPTEDIITEASPK